MSEFSVLGKVVRNSVDRLDTFPSPGHIQVEQDTDEFTSLCPITGAPDWCRIVVRYIPDTLCAESKSVKLYYFGFRNVGMFCEKLAVVIAQRFLEDLKPLWLQVSVVQVPRGGIGLTATYTWPEEEQSR